MARKPVVRSLPDLAERFRGFRGFGPYENRGERIAELLREVAEEERMAEDRPFYAVAAVAGHFKVSTRTVSHCYRRLSDAGVLRVLRGSRTLLRGRRAWPLHPVLGVVGLVVYLPGFIIGQELRSFYVRLEAALRRRRFVANFIFYRHDETGLPEMSERLLAHGLDTLFWMNPHGTSRDTIASAMDAGISVVLCCDGRATFPRGQYFYDTQRALSEAMAAWRGEGIESVSLWHDGRQTPPSAEFDVLVRVLRRAGMPFVNRCIDDDAAADAIDGAVKCGKTGIVLLRHGWYESLASQFPTHMLRLFASNRLLLVQGPLFHPLLRKHEIKADIIVMPAEAMAARIARDIAEGRADTPERLATFHSRYHPRVPLASVSRDI